MAGEGYAADGALQIPPLPVDSGVLSEITLAFDGFTKGVSVQIATMGETDGGAIATVVGIVAQRPEEFRSEKSDLESKRLVNSR